MLTTYLCALSCPKRFTFPKMKGEMLEVVVSAFYLSGVLSSNLMGGEGELKCKIIISHTGRADTTACFQISE